MNLKFFPNNLSVLRDTEIRGSTKGTTFQNPCPIFNILIFDYALSRFRFLPDINFKIINTTAITSRMCTMPPTRWNINPSTQNKINKPIIVQSIVFPSFYSFLYELFFPKLLYLICRWKSMIRLKLNIIGNDTKIWNSN
jgi:hypothetical protein